MSTGSPRRAWAQPAARLAVVGCLAAGVVLGADRLGSVSAGTSPEQRPERVAATTTTGYCPGDPFAADDEQRTEATVDVTGSVAASAAPPEVLDGVITPSDEPGRITLSSLSGPPSTADRAPESGPPAETSDDLDEPVMVRGTEKHAPGLASGQSFVAGGDRAIGLAAQPCTAPTADAWLVAGGGDKGRQEHLVLANPGGNPVDMRVEALGTGGDEGTRSVVVPAHGRSIVLLDSLGGTDGAQAVHVSSSGGLVVPTIVDRHLDGLTPAGVETVTPTAQPATRHVIPGNANGEERGMVLAAPGTSDAVVEIRRVDGSGSRSAEVTTVPAGQIVDVELPEGEGIYSWQVESDEPVVAAAHRRTAGSGDESDLSWSVATTPFGTLGGAALPRDVPADVRRFINVAADDGPAEADVLVLKDGEVTSTEVTLEEDHGSAVSVGEAEAVWVRLSKGSVHAAVLLTGREGVGDPQTTSLPLLPSRVAVRDADVIREG